MIGQKKTVVADMVVATMAQEAPRACLSCAEQLTACTSFWWRPSWRSLREGQPEPEVGEPGEWRHGWQIFIFFRF